MAFGDFTKSGDAPGTHPTGVGGDANTIWHQDNANDRIFELSTTDFSVVRQGDANDPSNIGTGIGGDANTIWHLDGTLVYELSTTDFSTVSSDTAPGTNPIPRGVGGDASTIWYCESGNDDVHELSTTDFSSVRSANSPDTWPFGIGGSSTRIWHCDYTENKVYELSTTDFSTVQSATSPRTEPVGIGGDSTTIWHSDSTDPDKIYALDVGILYPTDLLLRASGIKRSFWAGLGGQSVYQVELALGGMSTFYVSPIGSREPPSAVPPFHPPMPPFGTREPPDGVPPALPPFHPPMPPYGTREPPSGPSYSQADYEAWLRKTDIHVILETFGRFPTYADWVTWMQTPYFPRYF